MESTTAGAQRASARENGHEQAAQEAEASKSRTTIVGPALAEAIGVFILVFAGTGAVIALSRGGGSPDTLAIALAFGLALLIGVYAFAHVSGGHINPAVTIGLAATNKFPWRFVPVYVIAQFVGAVLASLAVWALFGDSAREGALHLGATVPGDGFGDGSVLLAEAIATFLLLIVVLALGLDERSEQPAVGLAIGLTVAISILAIGPISGGSLNPARSLGPALVSGEFTGLWLYFVGPLVGGVLGAVVYDRLLRHSDPPEVG